jgi:hypothetical protein
MSRIRVNIDKVALRGMGPEMQRAFVASLEKELHRILGEPAGRAVWAGSHRTPALRLPRVVLEPGSAGAGKLGTQVARGIGKGLKP